MKKILLSITSVFATLASLSLTALPASAAVLPDTGTVSYTVGDTVNLDLGCQEPNITAVNIWGGSLPPGLTIDAQGIVSGVPTAQGDYTISNYSCTYNGGGNGVGWAYWSLTFHITPILTPEPFLGMHSLNTDNCSIYIGYLFPESPDLGMATLSITNQSGTIYTEFLNSKIGNNLYETNYSLPNLNELAADPSFSGNYNLGITPFACDDTVSASISYQWQGAAIATKTVSGVVVSRPTIVPVAGGNPIQKLINLNNSDCQFRIIGSIPGSVQSGTTHLTINSPGHGTDQVTFTISDALAAKLIDFTFSPQELSSGPVTRDGIVSADYQISTQWTCGTTLYVAFDYRDQLDNYHNSTWSPELQTDGFGITPTQPTTPPAITITTTQLPNTQDCTVGVTVTIPDNYRPIAIGISQVNSTDMFTGVVIYQSTSVDGTIQAILSFANANDNSANVQVGQSWVTDTPPCSGSYKALVDSPGGVLASTIFSVNSQPSFVRAVPLNNSDCEFKVIAPLPTSADAQSMALRFATTGASLNEIDGYIKDTKLGQIFEGTFSPSQLLDDIRNNDDFDDWDSHVTSGISCNNLIDITLEYYQSGVKKTSTTTVIPTTPVQDSPATYSISAFPAENISCAISVKVKASDVERPLTVSVIDPDSGAPISLIYFTGGTTTDGTFTATISMASYSDFASSITAADKDIIQENRCFGKFEVGIFRVDQGMVASDITYLQRPPTVCGAGYTITQDRLDCDAVPRGFYTTNVNETVGTACPAGMTTLTTGSKSPNDCYKPIIQTIASLKAPKALKFKASANIPLGTNAGVNASANATGGCKAVPVQVVTKVKGKNVTSTMLKVTAGTKAATCSISLSSPETGKYLAFTKSLSIKVSKTGK